jgi:hypothetical protein
MLKRFSKGGIRAMVPVHFVVTNGAKEVKESNKATVRSCTSPGADLPEVLLPNVGGGKRTHARHGRHPWDRSR